MTMLIFVWNAFMDCLTHIAQCQELAKCLNATKSVGLQRLQRFYLYTSLYTNEDLVAGFAKACEVSPNKSYQDIQKFLSTNVNKISSGTIVEQQYINAGILISDLPTSKHHVTPLSAKCCWLIAISYQTEQVFIKDAAYRLRKQNSSVPIPMLGHFCNLNKMTFKIIITNEY